MRFLANMGISPTTVEFLREQGHDAKHLHEQGLDRLSDANILEKARAEGSIILTSDLGFGELAIMSKAALPSVIIFRLQPPMRAVKVNQRLTQILKNHVGDLERGAILSVEEYRVRVRRLPISASAEEESA